MNKKSVGSKDAADKLVKNIRCRTSRKYSAEEKIRIVLAGLRGEESIAAAHTLSKLFEFDLTDIFSSTGNRFWNSA